MKVFVGATSHWQDTGGKYLKRRVRVHLVILQRLNKVTKTPEYPYNHFIGLDFEIKSHRTIRSVLVWFWWPCVNCILSGTIPFSYSVTGSNFSITSNHITSKRLWTQLVLKPAYFVPAIILSSFWSSVWISARLLLQIRISKSTELLLCD